MGMVTLRRTALTIGLLALSVTSGVTAWGMPRALAATSTTINANGTARAGRSAGSARSAAAAALIRSVTRGYTDAQLSAYINWPLIASLYPDLPFDDDGLILANQPWSGAYSIGT